jgi:regulator of protease activity HflC (stomatin/prohibitin superfamily)
MDRSIQKNGLVNLAVALLIFIAGFAVTVFSGSLGGQAASIFLGLAVLVTFVSWFQMRLEENEQLEKLELDELARSRGASLFAAKDAGSYPARNAREQFEKYFIPAFCVVLLLAEIGGAWLLWFWSGRNPVSLREAGLTASLALYVVFFGVLFMFGRFSNTLARLEEHRLLRPGAGFLLTGAFVFLVAAAGLAGVWWKFPLADFWIARVLAGLLLLLAAENLLTLLLEIYRPRVKGRVARPLYESRIAGLLAQPESLFTAAAQTLDYQFGFKVSETWFFQACQKNLPALLLVQLAVLFLSTCFFFVENGEQAVREHFGRPVGIYGAGAHLKLPWPIDNIFRLRTEQIQSFAVGYTPDAQSEAAPVVLWTQPHGQETNFVVGYRPQNIDNNDTNNGTAQPVGLISVSIPIQYQITNIIQWAYSNAAPADLLTSVAAAEVAHYLAGCDLDELLSTGRLSAASVLQQRIQSEATVRGLGAKIIFVGLRDIHPPTEKDVAKSYELVVAAEQTRLAKILEAQTAAIATNNWAKARAFAITNEAAANRVRTVSSTYARVALFTNQIPAFAAAPSVYRQRLYLQNFAAATKGARKYVVLTTNTQDVVIFDLEDKVRTDLENLSVTNSP